ncbi:MAG: aldose 1-epimerase [Betaproteobacteria bacterium]
MADAPTLIRVQRGESVVTLCPDLGAAIARFTWRGIDILRRTPDSAINERLIRQMGAYPLVPYSNRIGQGRLIVGEQKYTLRQNFPPGLHAIHGFGWQRAWQIATQTVDSVSLRLQHTPDADWPFACEARQVVRLTANALQLELSVRNIDTRVMPAGLGFHPFFPLTPETHLQSDWKGMWKMSADSLPTELGPVPPEADFSQLRPVAGWRVDHCFTGWSRRAVLDYPTHRLQIDASDLCRQIVVFAPNDGRNFIALEPVTNINNAFALAANGRTDTGMRMLASGESMEISMSITLSGRAGRPAAAL